jgi:hypothetical protein
MKSLVKRERRWRGKLREGKSSRREQDECVVIEYNMNLGMSMFFKIYKCVQKVNSLSFLSLFYMDMSACTIFTLMGNSHRVEHSRFSGDRCFFL